MPTLAARTDRTFLQELGLDGIQDGAYAGHWIRCSGAELVVRCPATGEEIGRVRQAGPAEYEQVAAAAHAAFMKWREVPAPRRGELVRRVGDEFRRSKDALGRLVSLETGKIYQEGLGEIQEAVDIADFATGLSRQLYGLTLPSERPQHSMKEQWHPLGVVGVISAFNFPAAVWAWNSCLAAVCGDSVLWKPSWKTPLTAVAMTKVAARVLEPEGFGAVFTLAIGPDATVGEALTADPRVPLISATGSCRMGKHVAQKVAARCGRAILELGGNNAVVVLDDADLEMAARSILFGAVGTAGQRCTSTRRVLVQKGVKDALVQRLLAMYSKVRIGHPLDPQTLMGPLVDETAVLAVEKALARVRELGGKVLCGGERLRPAGCEGGWFLKPAIALAENHWDIVQHETFGPILYLIEVADLDHALQLHNAVPQGLSSAIFTRDVRAAEKFTSVVGSDCGIANVNIGTSGAEIGGAFGGEKETGGGRESGSDAWKAYMRRQTNTVNWGDSLPLAQGVSFDVG